VRPRPVYGAYRLPVHAADGEHVLDVADPVERHVDRLAPADLAFDVGGGAYPARGHAVVFSELRERGTLAPSTNACDQATDDIAIVFVVAVHRIRRGRGPEGVAECMEKTPF
jgi:hypothetical protein